MQTIPELKKLQRGDIAVIGKHPHLGEIEWIVLDRTENQLLLISRYVLDAAAFDPDDNKWKTSELRRQLYRYFTEWFDWIEQELIDDPEDPVFLLSAEEAKRFFPRPGSAAARMLKVENGQRRSACWDWWLRSPGMTWEYAAYVTPSGEIDEDGFNCAADEIGIRPAIRVHLERFL